MGKALWGIPNCPSCCDCDHWASERLYSVPILFLQLIFWSSSFYVHVYLYSLHCWFSTVWYLHLFVIMLQTRFSACVKKGKYRYIIQIYFYLLPLSACKAAIIKKNTCFCISTKKKLFSCCSKVEKLVILTTQKILQLDEFDDDVMPIYENTFNSDPGTFVFLIVLGFCVVIRICYLSEVAWNWKSQGFII